MQRPASYKAYIQGRHIRHISKAYNTEAFIPESWSGHSKVVMPSLIPQSEHWRREGWVGGGGEGKERERV